MKLDKQTLLDILESESEDGRYKNIEEVYDGDSRWSKFYNLIFFDTIEEKHYSVPYSVGATEQQSEYPFDYIDEAECFEVIPVEKKITVWKKV